MIGAFQVVLEKWFHKIFHKTKVARFLQVHSGPKSLMGNALLPIKYLFLKSRDAIESLTLKENECFDKKTATIQELTAVQTVFQEEHLVGCRLAYHPKGRISLIFSSCSKAAIDERQRFLRILHQKLATDTEVEKIYFLLEAERLRLLDRYTGFKNQRTYAQAIRSLDASLTRGLHAAMGMDLTRLTNRRDEVLTKSNEQIHLLQLLLSGAMVRQINLLTDIERPEYIEQFSKKRNNNRLLQFITQRVTYLNGLLAEQHCLEKELCQRTDSLLQWLNDALILLNK